jgi:hypothetical protein
MHLSRLRKRRLVSPYVAMARRIVLRQRPRILKAMATQSRMTIEIGVRVVWLVDPERHSVTVYRRGAEPQALRPPQALTAEPVLEGLELPLEELFAGIPRSG